MSTPKVTELVRNGNVVGTRNAGKPGAYVTPPIPTRLRERLVTPSAAGCLGSESRVRR